MNIIDTHVHAWDPSRGDHTWLGPQHGPINRRTTFEEFRSLMPDAGVAGAVLVQSADAVGDTRHLIKVAHSHDDVLGVVVWLPLDDPAAMRRLLRRAAAAGPVVGMRTLLHTRPDPAWFLRRELTAGLAEPARSGLSFAFMTSGVRGFAALPELARRHPDLRIVVDHLGKPPFLGSLADRHERRRTITEAAAHPNVFAKPSGLHPSGSHRHSWTSEAVLASAETALAAFDPGRLMPGSDWPLREIAGGHRRVWATLIDFVNSLTTSEAAALRHRTAADVYRLDMARTG